MTYTLLFLAVFSTGLIGVVAVLLFKIYNLKKENLEIQKDARTHNMHTLVMRLVEMAKEHRLLQHIKAEGSALLSVITKKAKVSGVKGFSIVKGKFSKLVEDMKSRDGGIPKSKGSASFFLKEINEHKKSLEKDKIQ